MATKTLMGDPLVDSQFKLRTGVNLQKEEKKIMVLCTIPEGLRSQVAVLDKEVVDGMVRRFKSRNIQTINHDEVDKWLSKHGGMWESINELAENFDADFIIHVSLDKVTFNEPDSPHLYRGNATGNVTVYEVKNETGFKRANQVFAHEYRSNYPRLYPLSRDQMQERTFRENYINIICNEISRMFYDYPGGDDVY